MKRSHFTLLTLTILTVSISYCFAQETEQTAAPEVKKGAAEVLGLSYRDEQPKFYYDSKGKTDPMDVPWLRKGGGPPVPSGPSGPRQVQPQISKIEIEEQMKNKVNGIVYCEMKPSDSLALVGGKIVKLGESVKVGELPKTGKITRISKEEVFILYDGKTYTAKVGNI